MAIKYNCGCVEGHYWCSKHDIYNKQNKNDIPPHGYSTEGVVVARPEGYKPEGCTCFQVVPCGYCINNLAEELGDNVKNN